MPKNHNGAALSTRHPDGCSGAGHVLSEAGALFYDQINASLDNNQLDNVHRSLSVLWGDGRLSDADAEFLYAAIDKRRARSIRTAPGFAKPLLGNLRGRVSVFPAKRYQRSPDRKASRARQRMFGGAGSLPPQMREHYTQCERAVLSVVALEIKKTGNCDWCIDKIAALAGVSKSTAKNALREARVQGHLRCIERKVPGRKNLTNLYTIAAREWLAWIKVGPIGVKMATPTMTIDLNKERAARFERPKGARRGEKIANPVPEWRKRS